MDSLRMTELELSTLALTAHRKYYLDSNRISSKAVVKAFCRGDTHRLRTFSTDGGGPVVQ